jgi:hypothetical protein
VVAVEYHTIGELDGYLQFTLVNMIGTRVTGSYENRTRDRAA